MSSQWGRNSAKPVEEPVDPALFRRVCGRFATGITVVTTRTADGRPHGLTINSFSSVSLEPPLILVSISVLNPQLELFTVGKSFAVNVLSDQQEEISRRFSGLADERFDGVPWEAGLSGGAPLLAGALAWLECTVERGVEAGDHTILIGKVTAAHADYGHPLVFFGGSYRQLSV